MNRREFLKLPTLLLAPQEQTYPEVFPEEMTNDELFDVVIRLAIVARANEKRLYDLLNLTRTRDMNIGTILWNGQVYQEKKEPFEEL